MAIDFGTRVKGGLKIFFVPGITAVLFVISIPTDLIGLLRLVVLAFGVFYVITTFFQTVSYDNERTSAVDLSDYSLAIRRAAVMTTRTQFPIFRVVFSVMGDSEELNQSQLSDRVRNEGCKLTPLQISKYVKKLGEQGFFEMQPLGGTHEIRYKLTEEGKFAKKILAHLFPRNSFMFILRNELGYRNIRKPD